MAASVSVTLVELVDDAPLLIETEPVGADWSRMIVSLLATEIFPAKSRNQA